MGVCFVLILGGRVQLEHPGDANGPHPVNFWNDRKLNGQKTSGDQGITMCDMHAMGGHGVVDTRGIRSTAGMS